MPKTGWYEYPGFDIDGGFSTTLELTGVEARVDSM
jgi:hypothetical protein